MEELIQMKTKTMIARIAAFCSAVALSGSLFFISPVTAFAGGADCICEDKCTENHINDDCPICREDYTSCEGTEPVAEPETEPMGPLTPDGNMTLVDDYGSIEAGGKQFITVVTKNGNFFYIIIDRDDDGNETVHFLNMVDESDLLSLMDEDQINEYIAVTGKGKAKTEPTVEKKPEPVKESEPAPQPEEPAKEPEKKSNFNGIMSVILIIALSGAAGFMYYTSTKNSKKKDNTPDPDADYTDDDYLNSIIDESEEEDDGIILDQEDGSSGEED